MSPFRCARRSYYLHFLPRLITTLNSRNCRWEGTVLQLCFTCVEKETTTYAGTQEWLVQDNSYSCTCRGSGVGTVEQHGRKMNRGAWLPLPKALCAAPASTANLISSTTPIDSTSEVGSPIHYHLVCQPYRCQYTAISLGLAQCDLRCMPKLSPSLNSTNYRSMFELRENPGISSAISNTNIPRLFDGCWQERSHIPTEKFIQFCCSPFLPLYARPYQV